MDLFYQKVLISNGLDCYCIWCQSGGSREEGYLTRLNKIGNVEYKIRSLFDIEMSMFLKADLSYQLDHFQHLLFHLNCFHLFGGDCLQVVSEMMNHPEVAIFQKGLGKGLVRFTLDCSEFQAVHPGCLFGRYQTG